MVPRSSQAEYSWLHTTELDRKEMGTTMCGAMQNTEYFNDTEVNDGEFSGDVPVKLPDSSSEFFLALEFAVDEAEVKGKTGSMIHRAST